LHGVILSLFIHDWRHSVNRMAWLAIMTKSMTSQISTFEVKTRFGELLARVAKGEKLSSPSTKSL
jgi:hypothetical protein